MANPYIAVGKFTFAQNEKSDTLVLDGNNGTTVSVNLSGDWTGSVTLQRITAAGALSTVGTYTTSGSYDYISPDTTSKYRLDPAGILTGSVSYHLFISSGLNLVRSGALPELLAAHAFRFMTAAVPTKNSVFADAVYGVTSDNTRKIRAAVARMRLGEINPVINCIGDSTTRGLSTGGGATQGPSAWPVALANALNARGIPAGGQNVIGTGGYWGSGTQTAAQYATGDNRLSASAGTVPSTPISVIGGTAFALASGGSVSFTLPNVTHIDIIYATRAVASTFGWSIDGGSVTNISANAPDGQVRVNVGGPLTLGSHTIKLDYVSGSTNIPIGVIGYNNSGTRKELNVLNLGISGATSTILLEDFSVGYGRKSGYMALQPALTMIEGGVINDGNQGVIPIATTRANLKTLIQDAKTTGDVILCTAVFGNGNTWSTVQDSYAQMMYELAEEEQIPLFDIRKLWLSFAKANADGFTSDNVSHPSARGYADMGALYDRLLADIIG